MANKMRQLPSTIAPFGIAVKSVEGFFLKLGQVV